MEEPGEFGQFLAELRKGNLILFDHMDGRNKPGLIGEVERVAGETIHFSNGMTKKVRDCAPVLLNGIWLARYGVDMDILLPEIKYLHHLQNKFGNKLKNNQTECAGCGKTWGWNDKDVFNFDLPVGKRVWSAVCLECRAKLEHSFKSKTITYNDLMKEFSTISGRIAKKCAFQGSPAVEKLKAFVPEKRGKNG